MDFRHGFDPVAQGGDKVGWGKNWREWVRRRSKNPNDLLVWCEWDTTARMKKFAASAALRAAMKTPGVSSKPAVSFCSKLEDLRVG